MIVHFDRDADALYIVLNKVAVLESEEIQSGIVLDFDAEDHIVAVEILRASQHVPGIGAEQFRVEVAQPGSSR